MCWHLLHWVTRQCMPIMAAVVTLCITNLKQPSTTKRVHAPIAPMLMAHACPTPAASRDSKHLETLTPGPVYNVDPAFDAVKPRRASWSISRSPRTARLDNGVPGPGTYLHGPVVDRQVGHSVRSEERSSPAVTITARYAASRPPASPGPSDYSPKDSMRKSAPCFTLHGSSQKVRHGAGVPGGGSCTCSRCMGDRFSSPSFGRTKKSRPSCSMQ